MLKKYASHNVNQVALPSCLETDEKAIDYLDDDFKST